MEMETIYLVTFDGCREMWGAEIYALGAYRTKEEAEQARDNNGGGNITELKIGETLEVKYNEDEFCEGTECYLGGYIE